jgi:two-component system LytT family response regulator
VLQLNIWICDDDVEMTEYIASKVKRLYPNATIQPFYNGSSLLEQQPANFDVLFLDIEMSDRNGIEIAQKLRARNMTNPIIFVSAYEQYVFQAFDVQAFHYLVKPFDQKKFYMVLQDAYKNRSLQESINPFVVIKAGFELHKVFHDEIYFIEVQGRKITVHTDKKAYSFNGKLQTLEEQLGDSFFRIHRSFLVHFKFIANYDQQQITLDNGAGLTLSQKKYTQFVQAYLHYIKRKGFMHT